jgi:hypothetical protein
MLAIEPGESRYICFPHHYLSVLWESSARRVPMVHDLNVRLIVAGGVAGVEGK